VNIELRLIRSGQRFRVFAIQQGSRCKLLEFLDATKRSTPEEHDKLLALLQHSADNGPPRNEEKCKLLGNKIFEFKTTMLRVAWFYDEGYVIICANGWKKERQKAPRSAIDEAEAARVQYFSAKTKGQIRFLSDEYES